MIINSNRDRKISFGASLYRFITFVTVRFLPIILLLIAIFFSLSTRQQNVILQVLRYATDDIVTILIKPIDNTIIKIQHTMNHMNEVLNVYQQNIELKQEVSLLKRQNQEAQIVLSENLHLKQLLHFVPGEKFAYKTARLLAVSAGPYVKTGIIDAGTDQNLKQEQVVVSNSGVIGRLINVGKNSSRILFVNDYNSRIPIITAHSRERGILVGNNSDTLDILYLPKNSQAQIGELILTSGDGEFYPAGLPVARISTIKNNDIQASSFLDLKTLEFVSILYK